MNEGFDHSQKPETSRNPALCVKGCGGGKLPLNQRVVETRLDMVRISEDSASEKKPHPQMEKKEHFLRTPPTLVVLLMNRLRERSDPPVSRTPAGVPNPRWCPKPPPGLQNPIGTWAIPLLASKELGTWWRQKHPFWSVCIHMQKIREMHSATKFQQKRFIILNTFFSCLYVSTGSVGAT